MQVIGRKATSVADTFDVLPLKTKHVPVVNCAGKKLELPMESAADIVVDASGRHRTWSRR